MMNRLQMYCLKLQRNQFMKYQMSHAVVEVTISSNKDDSEEEVTTEEVSNIDDLGLKSIGLILMKYVQMFCTILERFLNKLSYFQMRFMNLWTII